MRGYDVNEYEDYDEYEDEESGQEDEYEEEEEFWILLWPLKPVIAQRVIQESKPVLEDQQLASRLLSQYNSKTTPSAYSGPKTGTPLPQPPRVSELKRKVEKIKSTRDYSFLLFEDAELPAPSKSISTPHTEVRQSKLLLQNKQASTTSGSGQMSNGCAERKPLSSNGQSNFKAAPNRQSSSSKPNTMAASNSKLLNGSGPGRPSMPNGLQSKKPVASIHRSSLPSSKSSLPSATKKPTAKLQYSASRQQLEQRRVVQMRETSRCEQRQDPRERVRDECRREPRELNRGEQRSEPSRGKIVSRNRVLSAKPHKPKPVASRISSHDQRPKKRPARPFSDEEDEGEMAISMIRNMFRYNPSKFAGRDDDDSDMEANFEDILNEEKRSARIAKKEDEEQLRLIELEEKRERVRKRKKRKMGS